MVAEAAVRKCSTEWFFCTTPVNVFFYTDHSVSKYAKFSEKPTFLTPVTHTFICASGGKKC